MPAQLNRLQKRLFRAPRYLYRWGLAPLLGRRFLLLVHTGRRSGQRRETVLEVMEYRQAGPEVVVMSAFGRNAAWLRNIEANRDAEVVVGRHRFVAVHRILGTEEALSVVRGYEQRNRWMAPLLRVALSRLLGWQYQGSDYDRRKLVEQLPLIALRPRSASPWG